MHKAFLADQWRDRAGTHLPGATVSMVGCGDADCTGDVVVATIQTLLSRGLACAAEVGLVIVDEVHRIAAPSFSKVLFAAGLNAPALLGLSATPTRADKLTHVIHWLCGPLAYSHVATGSTHVTVATLTYRDGPTEVPQNRRGDVDHATMLSRLANDDARTAFIVKHIILRVPTTADCLVLSHRRDHCKLLAVCLRAQGYDAATYLGGDKSVPTTTVIVSTYALVSEGFDVPRLRTLVLATPASNVTQAVGRILRGSATATAAPRLVLDVVDANPVCYAQAAKRKTLYKSSGFEFERAGSAGCPAHKEKETYMFVDDA